MLRFGEFKTKAGRLSPVLLQRRPVRRRRQAARAWREFYARRLVASGLEFDMLFGPAYKGITLAAAGGASSSAGAAATFPSPTTARKPRITARAASSSAHHCEAARSSSMM